MIEVDQGTVLDLSRDSIAESESAILYFKDKWTRDIYHSFKNGYDEMSQINLSLSEIGLEDDMTDLHKYETRLTGRDYTWWSKEEMCFMLI